LEVPPEQQGRRRLVDSYLIPRTQVIPDPEQPRKEFDEKELTELTASIRTRGIKQPLTVRWNPDVSKYMIIDGGRRFAAATRLELADLPCWVQRGERQDILIDQIVHNWQRSNLRPYETADALVRLRDEFSMSQKDMVEVTGKSKSEISKLLALRDKVAPELQELARTDESATMTKRQLYQLSRLDTEDQLVVADEIRRDNLSSDETEQLVKAHAGIAPPKPTRKRAKGIGFRQKRFRTKEADVLITFRRANFNDDDLRTVVHELRRMINREED